MKRLFNKLNEKSLILYSCFSTNKMKKGDGMITWVLAATFGAIILIAFYVMSKNGLSVWGDSFKKLVSL